VAQNWFCVCAAAPTFRWLSSCPIETPYFPILEAFMNEHPKADEQAEVETDSPTVSGHTPGSAEGVDESEGHDQSERAPIAGTSATTPAEG